MLYLPITRNWILSRRAQRVYFPCAILTFYLFVLFLAGRTAAMVSSQGISPVTMMLLRLFLWPGIIGKAVLAVGMWYFWFNFDRSHWMIKAFWFVLLFLGLAVGAAIYYVLVYRRSAALEADS